MEVSSVKTKRGAKFAVNQRRWCPLVCLYYQILTLKVLPERPVISPSLGSAMVHVVTSPLPVVSIISIIFGFPSVVIWKYEHKKIVNVLDYPVAHQDKFCC